MSPPRQVKLCKSKLNYQLKHRHQISETNEPVNKGVNQDDGKEVFKKCTFYQDLVNLGWDHDTVSSPCYKKLTSYALFELKMCRICIFVQILTSLGLN